MILALLIAKLVPVAYGIKKLQIACVVEDDKVLLHHLCIDRILNFFFRLVRIFLKSLSLFMKILCSP